MSSTEKELSEYIRQFAKLRTDRSANWGTATNSQAPHKPFLLLSILDLFAEGQIPSNLIEITPDLGELFSAYWTIVLLDRRGDMALPFFHLRSSKFWHLVPKPGQEATLESANRGYSLGQLHRMLLGARLDEALYALLKTQEARDILRTTIIQTYFAIEFHQALYEQGELNLGAYIYSQYLIEQAQNALHERALKEDEKVRDQGFRKAVVRIYEHRCAFCGVRMLTPTGHTAVEAAHIIPWHISQNDDLHNGMALCRLCHWTFDEGLVGVSANYLVQLSKELRVSKNLPGHLLTVENRQILGPAKQDLWPDVKALRWHREKVFVKG